MRKYETVLVMSPDLSENDIKEELKKIENTLQSNSAQNIKTDRWGKKELGFRMRGKPVGNYVCLTYETDNSAVQDVLTAMLRIHEHVLKFQSHRLSDKVRKVRSNPRRRSSEGSLGADDFGEVGEMDSRPVRV